MASEKRVFFPVERETVEYRKDGRSVYIGIYGRWKRGAVIDFAVNGRWNPPRTGAVLTQSDLDDIVQQIIAFAKKNKVTPKISVWWS